MASLRYLTSDIPGIGGKIRLEPEDFVVEEVSLYNPVGVGEHVFAIPTDIVLETLEVRPGDIRDVQSEQVIVLRHEVIPFFRLSDILNIAGKGGQEEMIAVIVHREDRFLGLGVDTVLDQVENIIKPFDPIAQRFEGFSGGTILGDGRVALMLDIPTLFGSEALKEERVST